MNASTIEAHHITKPWDVSSSTSGTRTLVCGCLTISVHSRCLHRGLGSTRHASVPLASLKAGWDLCNALPGLLHVADLPDIASLIAPRPLLIQNGREDRLYDLAAVKTGFSHVAGAYSGIGSADAVALDLFDGGHRFVHEGPEAWVARWLPPEAASEVGA